MVATSELPTFKKRLEDERKRLLDEIDDMNKRITDEGAYHDEESGGVGNHLADDASDTFEQEKFVALKRNLERILELVERALRKIDQGTYGVCERCGLPIDPERLAALPYATLDIRCKEREEHRR